MDNSYETCCHIVIVIPFMRLFYIMEFVSIIESTAARLWHIYGGHSRDRWQKTIINMLTLTDVILTFCRYRFPAADTYTLLTAMARLFIAYSCLLGILDLLYILDFLILTNESLNRVIVTKFVRHIESAKLNLWILTKES